MRSVVVKAMSNPFLVLDRELATATARSFLSGLPSGLLDELIAVGDRIDVPAGSTVYRQGDYPRAFLVLHGLLRVYMTSPEAGHGPLRASR